MYLFGKEAHRTSSTFYLQKLKKKIEEEELSVYFSIMGNKPSNNASMLLATLLPILRNLKRVYLLFSK